MASNFGRPPQSLNIDSEISFNRPVSPNASIFANRPVSPVYVDPAKVKGMLHRSKRTTSVFDASKSRAHRR